MLSTFKKSQAPKLFLIGQPAANFSTAHLKLRFLNKFDEKLSEYAEKSAKAAPKKVDPSVKKAYSHPYHNERHPLHIGAWTEHFAWEEVVGQEQISVHYEPLWHARKYLISFFAGYVFLALWADVGEYAYWAYHKNAHFWAINALFFLEMRHHGLMPFPWLYYQTFVGHEFNELKNAYTDKEEDAFEDWIKKPIDQVEYYFLYKEFNNIKKDALSSFLTNEQLNLKKHLYDRAMNILKQTYIFEGDNQRNIIRNVKSDIAKAIQEQFSPKNAKQTREKFFKIALEGIKKGQMDYANDPLLPLAKQILQENISKYSKLTEKQNRDLLSLTPEQKQIIADADARAKHEFLTREPEFNDNRVKSMDAYKQKAANWGRE